MNNVETNLTLTTRARAGTGGAREVRREGFIPAILYGNEEEPKNLKIDIRQIIKGMHTPGFMSTVHDLSVDGKIQKAIVRDVQMHPVTDRPIHVDFMRVSAKSSLHIHVPIEFINEDKSPGLKRGGVLNVVLHEIEIVCPADKLPDRLTIDLEGLQIGDSVHSDVLKLPEGSKLANEERDNTIATIVAPTIMNEEVPVAEAAAPAAPAKGAAEPKKSS